MKYIKSFLCMLLVFSMIFAFSGCLKYSSNLLDTATTKAQQQTESGTAYTPSQSYYDPANTTDQEPQAEEPALSENVSETETAAPESTTLPEETDTSTPETTTEVNPASWSKDEIISFITNAVNKTKAYTGQVTVHRTENIDVTLDALSPNLPAIKSLANSVIGKIIKPTDETLTFSGGKATNSEGETIPMLLPKRQSFSLPASGVASASAQKSGNNIQVTIKLVSEKGTLNSLPTYNSGAMGYLDPSELDLDVVTISTMDVTYSGSTMVAVVNPDGYVVSANYDIPISMEATGKALGFTGSLSITAHQAESWQINW